MNKKQAQMVQIASYGVDSLAGIIDELNEENEKINKALDKACKFLDAYSHNDQFAMCRGKEEWKEWLMNDD